MCSSDLVTLKTGLGVRQGHWKCHYSIERIGLPTDVLSCVASEIINVEKYLEIRVRNH